MPTKSCASFSIGTPGLWHRNIATTLGEYTLRSSHWFLNPDTWTKSLPRHFVSKCIHEAAPVYGDINIVKSCQSYFSFNLHSVLLKKRAEKFDIKYNKKLIRRWDSERELSLRRHCTRTKNTIDSCINCATDRFLQRKFTKFSEITQCNRHYAVQGHSRSPILVPIESSYTTSY